MRVIDGNQWLVMTADFFQASRRRHQTGKSFGCLGRRQPGINQHGGNRQQIGEVVTPEQTGFDHRPAIWRAQAETHAAQGFLDTFGANQPRTLRGCIVLRVAEHFAGRRPRRQLDTKRIVEVDHRQAQARPLEQARLGRSVRFHRAVIVEMVARQVGEDRHIDAGAIHAPLLDADRTGFQRAGLRLVIGEAP